MLIRLSLFPSLQPLDDGSCLFAQMASSYRQAIAPGTAANRHKQAQEYIEFAILYRLSYLEPTITQACMFVQFLANKHTAPNTVKNYISGARTWIEEHGGNNSAFQSSQCGQLIKGLTKKSDHIPKQASPLKPHHIRIICQFLDESPSASLGVKPALLIGYSCFLRASNLFTPSIFSWQGPHTLLAGDIRVQDGTLSIFIRSTKTRSKNQPLVFTISQANDPLVCPVRAWIRYNRIVEPWALGPAFLHANNLPITSRQVTAIMRLALKHQTDINAARVSLHSLRRGATQTSVDMDIPLETIKTRGTWASHSGMNPYLPYPSRKVSTFPVPNLPD